MKKTNKSQYSKQELRVISVKFVPSPDAEKRLQKVYALLLRNIQKEVPDGNE